MSALFIWSAAAMTVSAQIDQARIGGIVYDQSGAFVAGAVVEARNERTGETRRVVTNLKPSISSVTVTAAGFNRAGYTRLELVVGQALDLRFDLKPLGTTETVM